VHKVTGPSLEWVESGPNILAHGSDNKSGYNKTKYINLTFNSMCQLLISTHSYTQCKINKMRQWLALMSTLSWFRTTSYMEFQDAEVGNFTLEKKL